MPKLSKGLKTALDQIAKNVVVDAIKKHGKSNLRQQTKEITFAEAIDDELNVAPLTRSLEASQDEQFTYLKAKVEQLGTKELNK